MTKKNAKLIASVPEMIKYGPIIMDGRKIPLAPLPLENLYSSPKILNEICKSGAKILENINFDYIAGCENAGVPFAVGLSLYTNKGLISLKKEEYKKHWSGEPQITGYFKKGSSVIIIDDALYTGTSLNYFTRVLRSNGLKVKGYLGIVDMRELNFKDTPNFNFSLNFLCSFSEIINEFANLKLFNNKIKNLILDWVKNKWSNDSKKWIDFERAVSRFERGGPQNKGR